MNAINPPLNRKLRMGLVGGGPGSFIGQVHITAATLDNRAELAACVLSSDPQKTKAWAPAYGVEPDRAYDSFIELIDRESALDADQRIDFLTIATPNHLHFPIAKAAIDAGLNVVCDKPMTLDVDQAEELAGLVEVSGVVFALTHNYSGYPMVWQARELVRDGTVGEMQAIRVCYLQGGLKRRRTHEDQKRAAWRGDPAKAGLAGTWADLGTHAFHLARCSTGMLPAEVSCQLKTFTHGRQLDDYGHALIRFENGALGTITASQISHGRGNGLSIEIDGTLGSLEWRQEEPDILVLRRTGEPQITYTRDRRSGSLNTEVKAACRLPAGHPEGFLEAFANLYVNVFDAMVKRSLGQPFATSETAYPNVYDGVETMQFVRQCVASSQQNGRWMPLTHP